MNLVLIAVFIYTVFFTIVSVLRYDAFSYTDFDFAIFTHECWKILHGSAEISIFPQASIFGNALELISFVTAPLFFIFGYDPKGLLFLQSLSLGLGAVPIFLIARRRLPQNWAVGFAVSYLLNPSIWYSNLYEYNPLVYCTLTLLSAFYFFDQKRFGAFMLMVFLTLINRVDLGIVTFMFGFYALLVRRPWKWVLTPSLVSLLWVVIGLLLVIPQFKNQMGYDAYYPQFGNGFGEIIINILTKPWLLWNALVTSTNVKFMFEILNPVWFLPLLALGEFSICAPALVQHLISVRPQEHTIYYHYTAMITPFIYIAAICALERLSNTFRTIAWGPSFLIVLSLATNFMYGPLAKVPIYKAQLVKDDLDDYKRDLLAQIPPEAAVMSTFEFSPMLAGRQDYYSFHYIGHGFFRPGVPYRAPAKIDYALVNFEDWRMRSFFDQESDARMREFLESRQFEVLATADSVALLKKGEGGPLKLYEIKGPLAVLPQNLLSLDSGLTLLSAQVNERHEGNHMFLDLDLHWTATANMAEQAGMVLFLVDQNGVAQVSRYHALGYGVYSTKRWEPMQEVVDHYRLLVPKNLQPGEYRLYVMPFGRRQDAYVPSTKMHRNNLAENRPPYIMLKTFRIP